MRGGGRTNADVGGRKSGARLYSTVQYSYSFYLTCLFYLVVLVLFQNIWEEEFANLASKVLCQSAAGHFLLNSYSPTVLAKSGCGGAFVLFLLFFLGRSEWAPPPSFCRTVGRTREGVMSDG